MAKYKVGLEIIGWYNVEVETEYEDMAVDIASEMLRQESSLDFEVNEFTRESVKEDE